MATTVTQIINTAYAKSSKNQPDTIATEATELLEEVQRILQGAFQFAANVNPVRFAVTDPVVGVASVWTRPAAAETIFRIEDATGAEVLVVPYDDRLCCEPEPSLYELGDGFIADPAQTAPPGATDTLTFFYAKRPDRPNPDNVTGDIDPFYPDAYVDLLALQLAIYLARKDGRYDEVALLVQDRDTWAQRFASWLQRGTANEVRRIAARRYINVQNLIPLIGGGA